MKILLISPPWYRFLGERLNEIPIGLCYLSSSLKATGHSTRIFNCDFVTRPASCPEKIFEHYDNYKSEFEQFKDPIWDRIRYEIKEFKPDYIGIHIKTAMMKSALKVARIAKEIDLNIKVVVGGIHPTLLPREVAREPDIDFVIKGEGEITFNELIKMGDRPHRIDGLTFRDGDKIIDGGEREPIKDISLLPFPDRENLVDKEKYSKYAFGVIITSRGCIFSCTFCGAKKMWSGRVRNRTVDDIIDEIRYVKEIFGTNYFNFRDDIFTFNKERVMEICGRIIEEKLNIVWRCTARADSLDDELVGMMKKAGCVQTSVGIESGSDRILKLIKKGETTEEIRIGIDSLKKYNIPVSAFIMIGFPSETKEEALSTLRFAKSLEVDTLTLSILTPYPGTEIYDTLTDKNMDYSELYPQNPKMGLSNLEEYKTFLEEYFSQVYKYNRNPYRLLRRFVIIFANNPKGALEKTINYFYH